MFLSYIFYLYVKYKIVVFGNNFIVYIRFYVDEVVLNDFFYFVWYVIGCDVWIRGCVIIVV